MKYILLICLLAATPAFSFDFKGLELNQKTTKNALKSSMGIKCYDIPKLKKMLCSAKTTVAGSDGEVSIILTSDMIINSLFVTFKSNDYENVKNAFITKFGTPLFDENEEVQNAMGAKFMQNTVIWEKNGDSMTMRKYHETINEGILFLSSQKNNEANIQKDKNKEKDI